jgi:hypothetical protein
MIQGKSKWMSVWLALTILLVVCSNADTGSAFDDNNAYVQAVQNPGPADQSAGNAAFFNLTGIWSCDDGGKYYIRQIGDTVAWLGESGDGESSVAFGSINGDEIDLSWMDVPKGSGTGSGSLTLSAQPDKLTLVQETGGFLGRTWTRPPTYEISDFKMTARKTINTNRSSIDLRPDYPDLYMASNSDLPSR